MALSLWNVFTVSTVRLATAASRIFCRNRPVASPCSLIVIPGCFCSYSRKMPFHIASGPFLLNQTSSVAGFWLAGAAGAGAVVGFAAGAWVAAAGAVVAAAAGAVVGAAAAGAAGLAGSGVGVAAWPHAASSAPTPAR